MINGIDIFAVIVAACMILGPMAAGATHTAQDRGMTNNAAATQQNG